MTWEEIRKQYAGQWVLIESEDLDEQLNVVAGEVVAHSPDKETIYKHLLRPRGDVLRMTGYLYAGQSG
jgi:hypothetical protein